VKREYKNAGDCLKPSPQFNQSPILRGFFNKCKGEEIFLRPSSAMEFPPRGEIKGETPWRTKGEGNLKPEFGFEGILAY